MTFEEFCTVKYYDTLYIDGIYKIRVLDVSTDPSSDFFGTVMWYNENEVAYRTHYDHLEFNMDPFEAELEKIAQNYFPVSYNDRECFKEGYRAAYYRLSNKNLN